MRQQRHGQPTARAGIRHPYLGIGVALQTLQLALEQLHALGHGLGAGVRGPPLGTRLLQLRLQAVAVRRDDGHLLVQATDEVLVHGPALRGKVGDAASVRLELVHRRAQLGDLERLLVQRLAQPRVLRLRGHELNRLRADVCGRP